MNDIEMAARKFGPDSEQVKDAVKQIDTHVGALLTAIDNEGRQNRLLIDLVIVSDHGHATITPNRTVLIDEFIDVTTVDIPDLGTPVASIWPKDANETDNIVAALQKPYAHPTPKASTHRKDGFGN